MGLRRVCAEVRYLGSYPRHRWPGSGHPARGRPTRSSARRRRGWPGSARAAADRRLGDRGLNPAARSCRWPQCAPSEPYRDIRCGQPDDHGAAGGGPDLAGRDLACSVRPSATASSWPRSTCPRASSRRSTPSRSTSGRTPRRCHRPWSARWTPSCGPTAFRCSTASRCTAVDGAPLWTSMGDAGDAPPLDMERATRAEDILAPVSTVVDTADGAHSRGDGPGRLR